MRLPVPDDFEGQMVSVSGAKDQHYGELDVNVSHVDRARNAIVREGEDGRFVGVNEAYAEEVAEFLGVDLPEPEDVPVADAIEMGLCPWCDEYDGDHLAQHASSAHPEEWAEHSED